jgi:simple sugar transport system permease protein
MTDIAVAPTLPTTPRRTARGVIEPVVQSVAPVVLALITGGILLAILGRDPFSFYGDILQQGLIKPFGWQQSVVRMATLLMIAAGLIVAFRAGLWNLGLDGQFLLAAAFVAGLSPSIVSSLGMAVGLTLCFIIAAAVGAAWTVVPAGLKASFGVNEIITTLMMNFIGISLANILVKGPFLTDQPGVPRTDILPLGQRLPLLFDTRIHIGILIALAAILVVHLVLTRTPFGLRLRILGSNPRAAVHFGLRTKRLTFVAFMASGALIGMSGAVSILGDWGSFRADWNPNYGFLVVPLVFLARLNALATIAFVALFAVIQIGGEYATRVADLPNDFVLVLVGLILFFMAITEFLRVRREQRQAFAAGAVGSRLTREDDRA